MESTSQSGVDSLPPLQYQALKHPHNTRLLCLHPGSKEERIECSLFETSLDVGEYRYHALSYVWGDPQLLHAIICNGQSVKITGNLYSVFKRLRKESEEIMLWVDALCINQSTDLDALRERAAQVEMMHAIYSAAESVFIDMGDVDEDTPALVCSLALFSLTPTELWNEPLENWSDDVLATVLIPKLQGSFWQAFARFVHRPWLERVWMFQEFVLAQKVTFLLGPELYPESFLTENIRSALELCLHVLDRGRKVNTGNMSLPDISKRFITGFSNISFKTIIRECFKKSSAEMPDLATLMNLTQFLMATNPQDKVYALLSLVGPSAASKFPVIYTESPDDTKLRLSLFLFEQRPLYLLYWCSGVDCPHASWTLPLYYTGSPDPLRLVYSPGGHNKFFCAGGGGTPSIALNRTDMSLAVKGVKIGIVASLAPIWQSTDALFSTDLNVADVYMRCRDISTWIDDQSSLSPRGYTTDDFWRTLVADLIMKRGRVYRTREFPDFLNSLAAFTRFIFVCGTDNTQEEHAEADRLAKPCSLYVDSLPTAVNRHLAIIDSGIPCQVPENTSFNDVIYVLEGAPLPLVLRPKDNHFRIVGCCYVHGMMDGELFENEEEPPEIEEIVIR